MTKTSRPLFAVLALLSGLLAGAGGISADPGSWKRTWPNTDFTRHSVPLSEILSGGPPKDGIPPIDDPRFVPVEKMKEQAWLGGKEPVIALALGGEMRAYPLRVMTWHEIVNDTVGGVPVAVTYCPLCNAAIVFDRRVDGRVLDFGTTGKLRHSDLVMYDRQTESWWQQFLGEGIVGAMTGVRLAMLPARVESFARFAARAPEGKVLVPTGDVRRPYGENPYVGYDSRASTYFPVPATDGIAPLEYVLSVEGKAWTLDLLRRERRIEDGDLVITWTPGQNSALDTRAIDAGRDIGNIVVQRRTADGLRDVPHDLTFAFAFGAFHPGVPIRR